MTAPHDRIIAIERRAERHGLDHLVPASNTIIVRNVSSVPEFEDWAKGYVDAGEPGSYEYEDDDLKVTF